MLRILLEILHQMLSETMMKLADPPIPACFIVLDKMIVALVKVVL